MIGEGVGERSVSAAANTVIASAKTATAGAPPPACAAAIVMHQPAPKHAQDRMIPVVRRRPSSRRSTTSWSTATQNVLAAKGIPRAFEEMPPVPVANAGNDAWYCEYPTTTMSA